MSDRFTEVAKPLVNVSNYRGDIETEVEQCLSKMNRLLDSGWTVRSTHTMTLNGVGYIVYVLRRFYKETEDVSTNKDS